MPARACLSILLSLFLLAGCAAQPGGSGTGAAPSPPPAAFTIPAAAGDMADVPLSGAITPPAEPAEAAALIAESRRYFKGEGVAADRAQAAALLRQAADLGSSQAAFTLALFKMRGEGMAQDISGGLADLVPVAKRGHPEAAAVLGERLIPLDTEAGAAQFQQAVYWLNIARRAGHPGAIRGQRNLLAALAKQYGIASDSGLGDSQADPIRFDPAAVPDHAEGVKMEYRLAAALYPGWRRQTQALSGGPGQEQDMLVFVNQSGQTVQLHFSIGAWFGKGLEKLVGPRPAQGSV